MISVLIITKNEEDKIKAFSRANSLKNDYGIETVFFEENDQNEGLSNFVIDLEEALNNLTHPQVEVPGQPAHEVHDEVAVPPSWVIQELK